MAFAALGLGMAIVFCVGIASLGLGQIRCSDAAGEIARQAARDDLEAIHEITERLPESATVTIDHQAKNVVVSVTAELRPWGTWFPSITITGKAQVAHEAGGR